MKLRSSHLRAYAQRLPTIARLLLILHQSPKTDLIASLGVFVMDLRGPLSAIQTRSGQV
jgi:hypothetical protein